MTNQWSLRLPWEHSVSRCQNKDVDWGCSVPYCFQNSLRIFCGLCHKSKLFSGQADAQGIAKAAENLRLELRSQLSAFIWRNSSMATASVSLTSTRGGRIQIPKEKLLDYLNQRDCLPLVMLLLARSHGRATVLTDPFIRQGSNC